MAFSKGDKVSWDWSTGTGEGTVDEVFTDKVTRRIKGKEITRNASTDEPAYLVRQDGGDTVLKSASELSKL
jgi:Hypervirulence associated proteins TUDOR domain